MNKTILTCLFVSVILLAAQPGAAQRTVSRENMRDVYETVKTPYKYGLVMVPEQDRYMMDSPTVFREKGKWYMTYVLFDSTGYETWLAASEDLLHWKTLGPILSFAAGSWDSAQRGGYLALQDYRWGGSYRAGKHAGSHWLSYIGGSTQGYEAGRLDVGMARTASDITRPHEWKGFDRPVMTPADPDAGSWECYTLYKSSVIRDPKKLLGAPFVMYYNAKGSADGKESIGIALSDDLKTWRRYSDKPVLEHPRGITGDAQIQRMGDLYVMFYFGAFWEGKRPAAFNRFACSYDLAHWTDWDGDDLIVPSEPYDALFAHKSFVLKHKGTVYHFYCAVNDKNQRGIAVATSRDMGQSSLGFR